MPNTKTINISAQQRLQLFHATRAIPAKNSEEMRANILFFKQFSLGEIEDAITALGGPPKSQEMADAQNAAFERAFDVHGGPKPYEISEAGATIFRGYMDRMAEVYPARKDQLGNDIPAGLPAGMARVLAPIVEALDEAFPVAEGKAA